MLRPSRLRPPIFKNVTTAYWDLVLDRDTPFSEITARYAVIGVGEGGTIELTSSYECNPLPNA